MTDITFINPNYEGESEKKAKFNRHWPPLSLANCAAILLEKKINCEIIDANALHYSTKQTAEKTRNAKQIYIASTSLDRWQCPHHDLAPITNLVSAICEQNPKAQIILVGTHGTVKPKEILEQVKPDIVIRGEPEETVLALATHQDDPWEIPGIAYIEHDIYHQTQDSKPPDISKFPSPAFHLLPMEKYFYEILGDHFTLIEASRGCPFQCTFCLQKMYRGYRKKQIENVVRDIDEAVEKHGVKSIYFMDLEFTINKPMVTAVCNHMLEKGYKLKWTCQTRADSVNPKILNLMKKAGCQAIHFGVETGSPSILKSIDKKITLPQIEQGIKQTHKAGIETACFFMFGLPGENKKDMEATIAFAKKINPTYASFHVASPYPGTLFHEQVKDKLSGELFPTAYNSQFSEPELQKIARKAFMSFYLRPQYIISRLSRGNLPSLIRQAKLFTSYVTNKNI